MTHSFDTTFIKETILLILSALNVFPCLLRKCHHMAGSFVAAVVYYLVFFSVSHASLCFCLNYRQMLPPSGLCVNRGCGWVLPMINAVGVFPQFLIMGARKELCSTRRVYFLALVVMSFKAGSGSSHMISLSLTLSLVFTK